MTAAEQAWIDNSLERLEALHAEREQVVASGDANKLAEIDEEIASLTEVLEAVADASGPINVAAANEAQPAAPAVTDRYRPVPMVDTTQRQPAVQQAPMPGTAAPQGLTQRQPAVVPEQPKVTERMPAYGQPQAVPDVAQAPMGQVPQGQPGGTMPNPAYTQAAPPVSAPIDTSMDYGGYDDDLDMPKKSPMIWVAVVGIVLVLGGVGAFFAMQGGGEEETKKPAEPQEAKVITAAEVPDDTSEPVVAQGAAGDRTAGTVIKESGTAPAADNSGKRSGGNRSGNRNSGNRNRGKSKDDGRNLKFEDSRDPLSGLK